MECATFLTNPRCDYQVNALPFPFCRVLHSRCIPDGNYVSDCPESSQKSFAHGEQSQLYRPGSDHIIYVSGDFPFYNDTSGNLNTETLFSLTMHLTISSSAVSRDS